MIAPSNESSAVTSEKASVGRLSSLSEGRAHQAVVAKRTDRSNRPPAAEYGRRLSDQRALGSEVVVDPPVAIDEEPCDGPCDIAPPTTWGEAAAMLIESVGRAVR